MVRVIFGDSDVLAPVECSQLIDPSLMSTSLEVGRQERVCSTACRFFIGRLLSEARDIGVVVFAQHLGVVHLATGRGARVARAARWSVASATPRRHSSARRAENRRIACSEDRSACARSSHAVTRAPAIARCVCSERPSSKEASTWSAAADRSSIVTLFSRAIIKCYEGRPARRAGTMGWSRFSLFISIERNAFFYCVSTAPP